MFQKLNFHVVALANFCRACGVGFLIKDWHQMDNAEKRAAHVSLVKIHLITLLLKFDQIAIIELCNSS